MPALRAGFVSTLALCTLGATCLAPSAWAQQGPAETQRSGVTGAFGVGVGSLGVGSESHGTFDYAASFGGYINNQWALAVELWGGFHSDDAFRLSHHNRGLSAQYWLRERKVWLKALVGAASMKSSFDDTTFADFVGVAFSGAGGWVFYERGDYHVDAQLRISVEGFEDTTENATAISFGVGVSYF